MRSITFFLLAAWWAALSVPTSFSQEGKSRSLLKPGKDGWSTYENPRFGFLLPVPPGLKPDRPPTNGDGRRFFSADEKVDLIGWGSFNVDGLGDVEERWKSELAQKGRKITYQRKTEKWFVVSGVSNGGTGFYTRYEADQNHCAGWTLTYPQAEEKKYSAWVEMIAKGWQARLGKGEDRIEVP
jgi:hypothetical protein